MLNTNGLKIPDYQNLKEIKKPGPGIIGTASCTNPRYRSFDKCHHSVEKPDNTGLMWADTINVAWNFNQMCELIMKSPEYEWLWLLGDDHVFKPDLLMKLLARDVDIITPLCLRRHPPYTPTINGPVEEGHPVLGWESIEGKSGVIEVSACGNAGMLIKRHVIEKIGGDWHRAGCHKSGVGGPDLWFCYKAKEAGYKILIDTENKIGHLEPMSIWAEKDAQGNWQARIAPAMDMPK